MSNSIIKGLYLAAVTGLACGYLIKPPVSLSTAVSNQTYDYNTIAYRADFINAVSNKVACPLSSIKSVNAMNSFINNPKKPGFDFSVNGGPSIVRTTNLPKTGNGLESVLTLNTDEAMSIGHFLPIIDIKCEKVNLDEIYALGSSFLPDGKNSELKLELIATNPSAYIPQQVRITTTSKIPVVILGKENGKFTGKIVSDDQSVSVIGDMNNVITNYRYSKFTFKN